MKVIERFGLLLFAIGFGLWLIAAVFQNYQVSEDLLMDKLGEATFSEIKRQNPEFIEKNYSTSVNLTRDLQTELNRINERRLEQYSYQETLIDEIVKKNDGQLFDFAETQKLFDLNDDFQNYQFEKLRSWGGWLQGREFETSEKLKIELTQLTSNIERWAIIQDHGYDDYAIKGLQYEIAKASSSGPVSDSPALFLILIYVVSILGALMYILPKRSTDGPAGIKNDGIFKSSLKNRGWLGLLTGSFLIIFYILLYFFPEHMTTWIIMVDPLSLMLKQQEAGRFFLYGFIYTLAILVMGVRMIIKYRHSRYQLWRTCSVMFFQLAFAFLIPEFLIRLNQPYFDFKNIWPLDYDFFFDYEINALIQSGSLGIFMLGWGIGLTLVAVPVMVYFFGKRWYCSWVCGCGGLAETLGDPFRQLSDKSLKAWKVERWMIHNVLVFAVLMTAGVLYTYWTGNSQLMGINTYTIRSVYGSWVGAGFAGVIGTGFYPLMGNRVWCRFGCPLAAYLGLIQRFKSRFRITTNGGQCISCGNCSTHCEMGIDVRWYAQRGENIIRSSCVGCGVCSAVCPRGVLNLENRADDNRFISTGLIGHSKK